MCSIRVDLSISGSGRVSEGERGNMSEFFRIPVFGMSLQEAASVRVVRCIVASSVNA